MEMFLLILIKTAMGKITVWNVYTFASASGQYNLDVIQESQNGEAYEDSRASKMERLMKPTNNTVSHLCLIPS